MKKLLAGCCFIIVVVSPSIYFYQHTHSNSKATKSVKQPAIPVTLAPVVKKQLPGQLTAVGTLTATNQVDVSPELPGQVSAILFKQGSHVDAEKPLVQLDDSIAQANLMTAQAELGLAKLTFDRTNHLFKKGATSQQSLDSASAALREKEADLAVAQVELDKLTLKAPFTGVVGKRMISIGDYVSSGDSIVTLVDLVHLDVDYRVPERELAQVKLGQKVSVTSSAYPDWTADGLVTFIAPIVDTSTRSILMQASITNAAELLRPGQFVEVRQQLARKSVLAIPESAVQASLEGFNVFTVSNGVAKETPVKVGSRFNGFIEITKGLKLNDSVVQAGIGQIKEGSLVTVRVQQVTGAH